MDGVFINLTDKDVTIKINDTLETIPANEDLLTPIRPVIKTEHLVSGIISSPLSDIDIHYLQSTNLFSTAHKITRAEKNIMINVPLVSPYIKYGFEKNQIEKINNISIGRNRLFILTQEDAEYWSSGQFENPFRHYRLFANIDNHLVEYPIPKTYYDVVVNSVGSTMTNLTKKIGLI